MITIDWVLDCNVDAEVYETMKAAADSALQIEGVYLPCSVSLRICNDENIKKINQKFRNINSSTDVLSFPSINWRETETAGKNLKKLKKQYDDTSGTYFLGDIVISMQHAQSQAQQYGHSIIRQYAYLITHSMFHLMGYDHMVEEEKKIMRKVEEQALSAIGISRENGVPVINDEIRLLKVAREAMLNSYSPYSGYPVGAALHCTDGRIYTGCNIENASFGLTNCAERTAVFKAVSEGAKSFDMIAIASKDSPPWPCGACRQVLNEFSPDIMVIVTWGQGKVEKTSLKALLPHGFGPDSFKE